MLAALWGTTLDAGYLAWRYMALRLGLGMPGTSLCSWSTTIDCDRVLLTPQANAFWVPNALLGLGFSAGLLVFWAVTRRANAGTRGTLLRAMVLLLGVGAAATLYFFWLLAGLNWFCPLCPLNHLLLYVAFGAALIALRRQRGQASAAPPDYAPGATITPRAVGLAAAIFVLGQAVWIVPNALGLLHMP